MIIIILFHKYRVFFFIITTNEGSPNGTVCDLSKLEQLKFALFRARGRRVNGANFIIWSLSLASNINAFIRATYYL